MESINTPIAFEKLSRFFIAVTPDHDNKKRKVCVKELIHTEKAYIDDMAVVHEVFELPLRKSSIIAQDEIDGIFVNWQDILQCNRNFHSDLMNRLNSGSDIIGDIICSHVRTDFCSFCFSHNYWYLHTRPIFVFLVTQNDGLHNVLQQTAGERGVATEADRELCGIQGDGQEMPEPPVYQGHALELILDQAHATNYQIPPADRQDTGQYF